MTLCHVLYTSILYDNMSQVNFKSDILSSTYIQHKKSQETHNKNKDSLKGSEIDEVFTKRSNH